MNTFFAAVFVFGLLVIIHELGHFTVAKLANIKVYELSMGIGPKLLGFRKGETAYNLRLLPIGGFVRMAGMDPEEDTAESEARPGETREDETDRGFNDKSVLQRMAVIFAGPLMNFVLAIIIFAIIFMFTGMPSNSAVIGKVQAGKPAAQAGLRAGDKITAINQKPVKNWISIVTEIRAQNGKPFKVTFTRDDAKKEIKVKPQYDKTAKRSVIGIEQIIERIGPVAAVKMGAETTYLVSVEIFKVMGSMLTKKASINELGGPVRVTMEIGKAAKQGFMDLLRLAGFLSINLGLFNLFPIPALDGSRLLFLTFEGLRGKPVDPVKENFIHLVGFGLLILLMVVVTYHDISRILS